MAPTPLPIESALPALRAALAAQRAAVLQAPPGAGKTTSVPLALLDERWLRGQRIVMLEPRRLAARAAATYMSRLLGDRPGGTIGYRVRGDTRVGPRTRIEVVTEGVLTRMIQEDPGLERYGLVIFDEFHERSIHADLGLTLVLQTRAVLREDLAVLVMSATLDGTAVATLLGDAPVVTSAGRTFAVETRYIARRAEQRLEGAVATAVRDAIAHDAGDILVFLPGAGEIRRVASMLDEGPLPADVSVIPLHGSLSADQQDTAIAPSPPGRRKVVLATSIAETSLTIEGVRVVIDSGAMRVPRFSPRSGMSRLETVRVTRASADQRRGRAGRVAPGIAYRLWSEHEDAGLLPFNRPEILETDLAPLVLALADAGVGDPAQLAWLDPPPAAAYSQARELLVQLGALDVSGAITAHGRKIAQLPMHPRLAHMLIAAPRGLEDVACDVAAVLGERDVLRGMDGPPDADLRLRLELVSQRGGEQREQLHGMTVDRDALRRVREIARELRQWRGNQLPSPPMTGASVPPPGRVVDGAGTLLALAYPDRIAQRRTTEPEPTGRTVRADMRRHGGRFLLRNGRGVVLPSQGALSAAPYLAVAELDDQRPEGRILLAAPLETEDLELVAGSSINTEDSIAWDAAARAVVARRRRMLGAIVIAESALHEPDPALVTTALLDAVRSNGIDALPWNDSARRLRQRIAFAASLEPGWPDVSDAALDRSLEDWLAPHLAGRRRWSDVERLDLGAVLSGMLDWRQRSALDEIAPTHLGVPSGSRIPIDYADPAAPSVSVRLQEMFGATETPRVGRGRIPLTIQLLSPAHRPVQVTRDLAGFWRTTYFDVRKDLRGRYPKHHWPDDPLTAPPTNRAKRRS